MHLSPKEKAIIRRASLGDPEYFRPKDAPHYGISRSTAYNWMDAGLLETKTVRRPGTARGVRLISVKSLRRLIEKSPSK